MTDNGRITWTNEKRKLSELIPWPRNPRQIKVDQVKRLQESLDEFGQPETIAIGPGNEIYNGHQRLVSWGDKYGDIEVDVRVASRALTEKEREKLTVFLHKGAAGEWNFDVLANEFELDDLLDWGFEKAELDIDLWMPEPEDDPGAQIDRAEELREKWGVESGQLWRLGEHRLICGDCTDALVVGRLMDGKKAGAVVTDPPYGVLDEQWDRPFTQDDLDMFMGVTNGVIAVFNAAKPVVLKWMLDLLPMPERVGVWRYSQIRPTNGMIWSWQPVFYWNCKDIIAWDSLDWYQGNSDKDGTHPTQKPVEMLEKIIDTTTGDILDPFLGSGTTLIACERLGRKCRAVEISPAYCAVAIQRWVDMTGQEPELIDEE